VKAAINRHKSNLAQIPNAIKQKKHELLTKVREDKQQITEVDAIRLEALKAIQDGLNL
jgi:hypothetical protein